MTPQQLIRMAFKRDRPAKITEATNPVRHSEIAVEVRGCGNKWGWDRFNMQFICRGVVEIDKVHSLDELCSLG